MKQVLFWSKYSANSKKLINLMDQHNAKIESVCIDNESVRQRIAKDKKIGISVVPTILALYQNGVIEKYEGEKAFELLYAAFPQKPPSSRATIKMQELPSPSCEGMGNIEEPVPAPVENKPKKSEYVPQSLKKKEDKDSSGQSSLDDLVGDDLFTAESSGDSNDDKEENETGRGDASTNNLPIKATSKLSSIAADIAASRDQMDANLPRPTQNNIKPV
tara:strand:+ start:104 stop:757 length:654 start_codon:yes stop_codon:yes gene_type:complete